MLGAVDAAIRLVRGLIGRRQCQCRNDKAHTAPHYAAWSGDLKWSSRSSPAGADPHVRRPSISTRAVGRDATVAKSLCDEVEVGSNAAGLLKRMEPQLYLIRLIMQESSATQHERY